MKGTIYFFLSYLLVRGVFSQEICLDEKGVLDFDTAVQWTLEHSLKLKTSEYSIRSSAADVQQATLMPNPIFSYQLDQFGGCHHWKGLSGCQAYYTLSQLFELGGKRKFRTAAASHFYYASLEDYEASQLKILNTLKKSFLETMAAQEQLKLAHEEKLMAIKAFEITKEQIQAGKINPIELIRAEITLCNAEIKEENGQTEWLAFKEDLSAFWSAEEMDFDYLDYPFYERTLPQPLENYLHAIDQNPVYIKAQWDFSAALEIIKLEKSRRIPDIEVSAGYESQEGPFADGLTIGISLPLPIFDRNQGGIARASAEAAEAKNEMNRIWLALKSKLSVHHKKLMRAYTEVDKLCNRILKSANQAYKLTEEGFQESKYDYLDVVEAQYGVYEVQSQYITALKNYHLIKADLDYAVSDLD